MQQLLRHSGVTKYANVTTFVDRDECLAFLARQVWHTPLKIVPTVQFQQNSSNVNNSSAATASRDMLSRQLLSGGVSVTPPPGMDKTALELSTRQFVHESQRTLFTHGSGVFSCTLTPERECIALKQEELLIEVANINSDERVYVVQSKLPYTHKDSEAQTDESKKKKHRYPFAIVVENSDFMYSSPIYQTAIRSLIQIESLTNSTLNATVKADARNSHPGSLLIKTAPTTTDEKIDRDYTGPGSGALATQQRMMQNRTLAAMQFQVRNQTDAMQAQIARLTEHIQNSERLQKQSKDEVTGGDRYPTDVIPNSRKDIIPAGLTAIAEPAARAPPHVIGVHDIRRESVGEVSGVPPALTGGTRTPVAVNQTVLAVLMATLESWRHILVPLVEAVFWEAHKFDFLDAEMLEQQRKAKTTAAAAVDASESEGEEEEEENAKPKRRRVGEYDELQEPGSAPRFKRTPGRPSNEQKKAEAEREAEMVSKLRKKYRLNLDFHGFADPLMTERMYAAEMLNEEKMVLFSAAYSGLSANNFDTKRLKEARERKLNLEKILAEQEQVKLELLKADLKLKQKELVTESKAPAAAAAAAAASDSAPKAAAGSGAGAGAKRKAPTHGTLEAPSVDRGLMKFAAGKTAGTGKLSAKVNTMPPATGGKGPRSKKQKP